MLVSAKLDFFIYYQAKAFLSRIQPLKVTLFSSRLGIFCRYYWTDFEVVLKKFLYCCYEADKVEESRSRKVQKRKTAVKLSGQSHTKMKEKKSLLLSLFCVLFVTLLSKFISVAWKVLQRL